MRFVAAEEGSGGGGGGGVVSRSCVGEAENDVPFAMAARAFCSSWMHLSTSVMVLERFDFFRRRSYSFSIDSIAAAGCVVVCVGGGG